MFDCCRLFAEQGGHAIITPQLDKTIGNHIYEKIYASLRNTEFWGKCPDFKVNGLWYEHEGYDRSKDLSNLHKRADTFSLMLRRGVKQSDRVILEDCGVGRQYAKRNVYRRVQYEHQNISEVVIRTSNGLEIIYKVKAD